MGSPKTAEELQQEAWDAVMDATQNPGNMCTGSIEKQQVAQGADCTAVVVGGNNTYAQKEDMVEKYVRLC